MDNNHTQNFDHLEYTVIRSNRKSICIEISPDLQIKVRAPQKMLDSQIRAFVASKDKWITDHLVIMQERLKSGSEHISQTSFRLGTCRACAKGLHRHIRTCKTLRAYHRRDIRSHNHPPSEDKVGKLQFIRQPEFQLHAHDYHPRAHRLCCRPRALPQKADEPLAIVLG